MQSSAFVPAPAFPMAAPATNMFSTISQVFIDQILHLREALQFYELNFAETCEKPEAARRLPGCGAPGCSNGQMHFSFPTD